MRTFLKIEWLLTTFLFMSFGTAANAQQGPAESCVRATCTTRYVAYGYNHVVHLENTCGRPMQCSVASDANPRATTTRLASGASTDVQTVMGSPASVCRAIVSCSPQ